MGLEFQYRLPEGCDVLLGAAIFSLELGGVGCREEWDHILPFDEEYFFEGIFL